MIFRYWETVLEYFYIRDYTKYTLQSNWPDNYRYFYLVPAYVEPQPTDGKFVVRKGSTITLSCRATGNPLPTVTWQRKVRKKFNKKIRKQLSIFYVTRY